MRILLFDSVQFGDVSDGFKGVVFVDLHRDTTINNANCAGFSILLQRDGFLVNLVLVGSKVLLDIESRTFTFETIDRSKI